MPGTRPGGIKAAATNKKKYGPDFYVKIGALGGAKSTGGGFAANRELAREAGRKGGMKSRKRPKLSNELRQEIAEARKGLHIWNE